MVCLDTTFIIDFLRGKEKSKSVIQDLQDGKDNITVASPSVMEIMSGVELGINKNEEKEKIIEFLSSINVLPLNKESAFLAGEIEGYLIMTGETIGPIDTMIGAIAKYNNEMLLTRNTKHFSKIHGLKVQGYFN
ncbi:MAG: PIN domain-containing protein [Patescibacteria group bacterium]